MMKSQVIATHPYKPTIEKSSSDSFDNTELLSILLSKCLNDQIKQWLEMFLVLHLPTKLWDTVSVYSQN